MNSINIIFPIILNIESCTIRILNQKNTHNTSKHTIEEIEIRSKNGKKTKQQLSNIQPRYTDEKK